MFGIGSSRIGSVFRRSTSYRTMLKSKIHRATVTQADLHYVGSVTVEAKDTEGREFRRTFPAPRS